MTRTQTRQGGPAMTEAYEWQGRKVVDRDGEKVGKVDEIYLDRESGEPEWALVNTGLFGSKSNFVPLSGAKPAGEDVEIAFTKDQVKDAPGIEPDGDLSSEEEQSLYEHYGFGYSEMPEDYDYDAESVGHDVSGPTTDDAMTRSEEEVTVGTRERERGRVRLRKYVVTEEVEKKVPVRKEKVRLEREPISDDNVDQAMSGPEISEEEHEVVLHEEEAVVEKRTVPKERVRLDKEVEVDEQEVSEEVRKERIEAEGDVQR
jgi:uncharacterized protein (TIGR02271 family)